VDWLGEWARAEFRWEHLSPAHQERIKAIIARKDGAWIGQWLNLVEIEKDGAAVQSLVDTLNAHEAKLSALALAGARQEEELKGRQAEIAWLRGQIRAVRDLLEKRPEPEQEQEPPRAIPLGPQRPTETETEETDG
jgi:hypothetical protein